MSACLICHGPTEVFLPFGRMPRGNGFLQADEFESELFFDLSVALCPSCSLVQLNSPLDREQMFHDHYAYYSSTSRRMVEHFEEFGEFALKQVGNPVRFVVEIGSNDGIMLQHFAAAGIGHLGVEPSANVAQVAMDKGIHTVCRFFDRDTARQILREHGPADLILGANVVCHVPYLDSMLAGVKELLKADGLFLFEEPYLADILRNNALDQIYDEHVFYFSASAVARLVARHEMELVDLMPQKVHGGSMRYVVAHRQARAVSDAVAAQIDGESSYGLTRLDTFQQFRDRVEQMRIDLCELLHDLQRRGKRIVGYGATAKSATVINFCKITPDLIDSICDTTPLKQGTYSPGAHIPIVPHSSFQARYPDYALLFAWNHAAEILEKEAGFRQAGGRWIVYVPQVTILP